MVMIDVLLGVVTMLIKIIWNLAAVVGIFSIVFGVYYYSCKNEMTCDEAVDELFEKTCLKIDSICSKIKKTFKL